MEYLRDFNYGQVSQLPDGTTLREFTIIAEDDKVYGGFTWEYFTMFGLSMERFLVLQFEPQKVIYLESIS